MSQQQKRQSTINNRGVDIRSNQQQQIFKDFQIQAQAQAEIQYYIYQDLQNLINLIYSREAVLEYFKNDPTHGMIPQSNNKLILQLNLSKAIQFDQSQQYKEQPQLFEFLQQERNKAYKILEKIIDNNDQLQNDHQKNDDVISKYLKEYKQQYAKQEFKLDDQFQLQETKQVAKFDEGVLQKMISSIQNVDNQVDQIRNSKSYRVPDLNEIQQKANEYYKLAQLQLKNNFPIQIPQANDNNNQMQIESSTNNNHINNSKSYNDISEKQELINFLIFSGFFNDQTIYCNSYNMLQEWIRIIKYETIIAYSSYNWFQQFVYQKEQFEYHCKLYYFFSIFFEYQKEHGRLNENQKIQLYKVCLKKIGQYPQTKMIQFFEYLKNNQEQIKQNCQQLILLQKEIDYICELYQAFCNLRN